MMTKGCHQCIPTLCRERWASKMQDTLVMLREVMVRELRRRTV